MKIKIENQNLKCPVFIYRNLESDGFEAGLIVNETKIPLYEFFVHNSLDSGLLNLNSDEFESFKLALKSNPSELKAIKTIYTCVQGCGFNFDKDDLIISYDCYKDKQDFIATLNTFKSTPNFLKESELETVNKFLVNIKELA